ncbi:MAG: serine/threonine protein phosphatase PrpC [Planctomycetota bacterium]|jgi:serine/threonine protein phosphatase PrpC
MHILGQIDVHGVSRRGATHTKNHDHFAIATLSKSMRLHQSNLSIDDNSRVHGHNQGHLFLVADGISGAPAPKQASGKAVDSVVQYFLNEMPWYHFADGSPEEVTLALEDALSNAQDDFFRTMPDKVGMGTTLTIALVFWPDLYIAHVGDSSCHLKRRESIHKLTTDHTVAEVHKELGGRCSLADENTLWNVIGGHDPDIYPDVQHMTLELDDVLVLLTDGIAEAELNQKLETVLRKKCSAEEICDQLVDRPRDDDQTAIAIRFLRHEEVFAESGAAIALEPMPAEQEPPLSLQISTKSLET